MSDRHQPIPKITATADSDEGQRIFRIMGAMMTGAAVDQKSDDFDPAQHTAFTMAAAGFLAGYLTGASIIAGTLDDRDKKRTGQMLLSNFRQGIDIGKQEAMNNLARHSGGGSA